MAPPPSAVARVPVAADRGSAACSRAAATRAVPAAAGSPAEAEGKAAAAHSRGAVPRAAAVAGQRAAGHIPAGRARRAVGAGPAAGKAAAAAGRGACGERRDCIAHAAAARLAVLAARAVPAAATVLGPTAALTLAADTDPALRNPGHSSSCGSPRRRRPEGAECDLPLMDAPPDQAVHGVTLPLPDCCGCVTESPYREGKRPPSRAPRVSRPFVSNRPAAASAARASPSFSSRTCGACEQPRNGQ